MTTIPEEYIWYYHKEGFSIIPLGVNKTNDVKRPSIKWETYQERPPTEEEIKSWIEKKLFKGIGIVCGTVSNNLAVIDIDEFKIIRETEVKLSKIIEKGMWVVVTGRGYHIYCRNDGDPGNKTKDADAKIDFQANGGYVVAPPTIHPTTKKPYHFFNHEKPKQLISLQITDAVSLFNDLVESFPNSLPKN